jgi:hypothetical protein
MEYLVAIANSQPIFFKGNVDAVVEAMLTVAKSKDLDFPTRSIALELMVTLTETAPALARRCRGLVQGLVPLAFSIMQDLEEEDTEWAAGKYAVEAEDENVFVGEEAVERAAAGMGGRVLAPPVLEQVTQFAASAQSADRRAAVAGLCRLAEGSPASFKGYFDQSLSFLIGAIQDASPRVRYEAVQCVGRFASLFTNHIEVLVNTFVPGLTSMLSDSGTCDRLRGHCASALINLTNPENCEEDMLEAHLEPLLVALIACLQYASDEVKPYCLDLLGCAAQVSDEAFAPYYASFMPGIKNILRQALGPDLVKLRGKAMECVGLIGDAVGVQTFSQDALEIMQELLGAMKADQEAQDITFEYILPACARISKALGPAFEPYLELVMTPLLHGANRTIECTIVDALDDDVEGEVQVDEDTGLETAVVTLGAGVKKRVSLNTHAVQQKNQAARMFYEFALGLKGHLKQYLVPCLEVTVSMITDKHSADVRSSASLALAKLFDACLHGVKNGLVEASVLPQVMSLSLNKLLENLKGEINATARVCAAECLNDILQACYNSGEELENGYRSVPVIRPDVANSSTIVEQLLARCTESVKRLNEAEERMHRNEGLEAEDKGAFAEENEEEEELLTQLGNSIGQLIKLHSDTGAMMPMFDTLIAPTFGPYMQPTVNEHFQIVACCMVDDALEFGGAAAAKYVPQALATFTGNLASDNLVLRQCSGYGIAQITKLHAETFVQGDLASVVSALVQLINRPDSRDDDNIGGTENALFALGTIATLPHYRALPQQTVADVTSMWLRGMPLREDEQEAKWATMHLASACESWDPSIMGGATFANLGQVLRIIAEVIIDAKKKKDEDDIILAHPATVERLRACIKTIQQRGVPEEVLSSAFGQLGAEHQQVLNQAC